MANSNYKSLFKATGLFGIVEFIRILLRIIVNMFASKFLGPVGAGLIGLIENTTQLIISLTSFGLNFTGIREIASNKLSNDLQSSIKFINLFSLTTGFLAAIISILFSTYLSKLTFDTDRYSIWFVCLAIYFVCTSFVQSRTIILEGLQEIKKLLALNIITNVINVIIVIGCYYLYEIQGVILSMILTSVLNLILFWRGTQKYNINSLKIPKEELKKNFKRFTKSGVLLAINTCIGLLGYLLIRYYLKPIDDGVVLGYYHVGNILMVSYVGILFIGINKFYFPKLAHALKNESKSETNKLVNNQLELCLLILIPAIFLLYFLGDFFIKILFSVKFLPVYNILIFGLVSIIFRGFNYIVGYIILSYNNFKQYFYINALSDIFNIFSTILLYKYLGLCGIGLALTINYILSALYTYYFVKINYSFELYKQSKKLLFSVVTICFIIIIIYFYFNELTYRIFTLVFFILSIIYSAFKLDKYLLDELLVRKLKSIITK
ncbi:Membrane protein involved in the export of O-antigen and teichoic acid [Paenimyroides ummariense]|uniref:Membrane protein involved in the export of O-antigen and teichoic acid n=1 Tax=Paenimyroides ummariense TaxID=913024 RepID=A0A1I4XN34_9FLAO|nr:oligosaccharide flippase family protein [Paenimyroides ummariense]SFN27227.1 Membrane protein involved in the export of O-antigen and teichoic acid [Paenimyroides ummariense]